MKKSQSNTQIPLKIVLQNMLWVCAVAAMVASTPTLKLSGDWEVAVAGTDTCPTGLDGADSMPIAYVLEEQQEDDKVCLTSSVFCPTPWITG